MNTGGFYISDWKAWNLASPDAAPPATPPLLRRRITPVGQKALGMAWQFPQAAASRLILSSRHGEFSRTLSLLDSVVQEQETSPADFTLSVHHALIGLLSIAQNNQRGHTAVASGAESFCFGLIEALGCLHENPQEPVLLIHFDDVLPGAYATFNETTDQPIALVLLLGAEKTGDEFRVETKAAASQNPQTTNHAQDFINFLQSDAKETISINANRQWHWTRHAHA